MDVTYSFGEWIRRRRKALDLTQHELAECAFCSVNTIKKLETDQRRPSRELAVSLANALAVPSDAVEQFVECARGLRPVDDLLPALPDYRDTQIRSVPPQKIVPAPLPHVASPIFGRKSELELLDHLLTTSQLVTIIGPGGIGKTRLALAMAHRQKQAGKTVTFVSLAELNNPKNLPQAIAIALGLQLEMAATPTAQILEFLQHKTVLLILDNFEHLLNGVDLLGEIQQTAADVSLLVTSRERLRLPGEQLIPLHGLRYPSTQSQTSKQFTVEELNQFPAVQLFLASARRSLPHFKADKEELLQLCRLTDGMPLALELAAGWLESLTLFELLQELQQNLDVLAQNQQSLPTRHQSVRAVFDTTWQLLGGTERQALVQLSVFRGGFTRRAATAVAQTELSTLSALASKQLIYLDHNIGRYSMHELLRQYALEHAEAMKMQNSFRQRHYLYYFELASSADDNLRGPEQMSWLHQLDVEQENFRTALDWAVAHAPADAARLALVLCWYWRIRNQVAEARRYLIGICNNATNDTIMDAALQYNAGHFAWMQGDFETARQYHTVSIQIAQALGIEGDNAMAFAHHGLGMAADQEDRFAEAQREFESSLNLFERTEDKWGIAFAKQWLGATNMKQGELSAARTLLEDSLSLFQQIGDRWAIGLTTTWLAWVEWDSENWGQALIFATEAHASAAAMGHWHSLGATIQLQAQIAAKQGDLEYARTLYREGFALYSEMGNRHTALELEAALEALEA
jgi:predicted ATPase/DNA-binding XRE family transcriptional regulator